MGLHPSHVTRISMDASSYDEICVNCGATDVVAGGWGKLAEPCPNSQPIERKGDWIQTYTSGRFYMIDPRPEEVKIEDIAHALALVNRYNGHSKEPISVAQHSVLVSRAIEPEHAILGLFHDAHEAYCGDWSRPLKVCFPPDVKRFIDNMIYGIDWVVFKKFGVSATAEASASLKRADDAVLATESRSFMSPLDPGWEKRLSGIEPFMDSFTPLDWRTSERLFLSRYAELARGR